MKQSIVHSSAAPAAIGPYSQGVICNAARMLYCSGQVALVPGDDDPARILEHGDVRAQTEQVMKNIAAVLAAGGASFAEVVKTTIFLTDLKDFAVVNEVYGRHFGAAPPARSTVQVAALPRGARVEIEVIAALS